MTPTDANRFLQMLKSLTLIVLSLDFYFDVTQAGSNEASKHLDMGKQLLAAGNLVEALSHFDLAVEQDSKNYLTYFRRATVYLALGKSKSALPDLDKSIQLRPGFSAALIQRGNVYLKQGNLQAAEKDFGEVYRNDNSNTEAMELLMTIQPLGSDISTAKQLYEGGDYVNAIEHLNRPIELCPWDPELKEIRAECFIAIGEYFKAATDLRATTKLRNDNTAGYFKLSNLYYQMGEAEDALLQIKECLKLDPDHKQCFPFYKKTKKLVKQLKEAQEASNSEQWDECVNKAKQILKTASEIHAFNLQGKSHICHCLAKGGQGKEALTACNEVLDLDPEGLDAMCDRAEAYISNEQYDEAIKDFQSAMNIDQESRRAREGMERAQRLLKNSQKRDYYKILGVKRNAKKKQIMKAYRQLAVQWHPDKYEGDDKKHAEKMFLDIAAAKEVLTDPEKREKFDNGEDPLDPEQQQQGGFHHGNPFQGFNPFGNGGQGFNFKFHFN